MSDRLGGQSRAGVKPRSAREHTWQTKILSTKFIPNPPCRGRLKSFNRATEADGISTSSNLFVAVGEREQQRAGQRALHTAL